MSDEHKDTDFDLDEDLFGFAPPDPADASAVPAEDEEDLEAIFAAFQEEEERERAAREAKKAREAPEAADGSSGTPSTEAGRPTGAPGESNSTPTQPTPEAVSAASAATPSTGAPAPVAVGTPGGIPALSKGVGLILVSLLLTNAMIAFVALRDSSTTRRDLIDVQRSLADSVRGLRDVSETADSIPAEPEVDPIVPPNVEDHPVFEQSIRDIEEGRYAKARQRIYAFLAVVDRLEDDQREKAEAKALYLLARATHLDALQDLEETR